MKYFILFLGIILLSSLVNADSTFFDNPADAFIMGGSATGESAQGSGTTGGAISGVGCLTNWSCSSWSSCVDGIQTRNCIKEKSYCYADLKKKPIESQNCSIDKSGDKNNTGSEDRIASSPNENDGNIDNVNFFSIKIIILVILIAIVIVSIILYKKRRYFRYGYKF